MSFRSLKKREIDNVGYEKRGSDNVEYDDRFKVPVSDSFREMLIYNELCSIYSRDRRKKDPEKFFKEMIFFDIVHKRYGRVLTNEYKKRIRSCGSYVRKLKVRRQQRRVKDTFFQPSS